MPKYPTRSISLGLLMVALGLRFFRLSSQSLWLDEGGTWSEATGRSWLSLFGDLFSPRQSYPLYHLLMKVWTSVFGDSELALRAPSALAGALAVVLLYHLAWRLSTPTVAWVAAGLLAINPFGLWQSQDAKVYSMLMAAVLWSNLVLLDLLDQTKPKQVWLWFASVVLCLSLHRLALLHVLGQVLVLALHFRQAAWHKWLWLGFGLLSLGFVAGIMFGLRQDPNAPPIGRTIGAFQAAWLLLGRLSFDRSSSDLTWRLLPVGLALASGLWLTRSHPRRNIILSLWLLPTLLFLAVLAAGSPLYEPRYLSFSLPLFCLILALGLAGIAQQRWLSAGSIVAITGLSAWLVFQQPYGIWSGNAVKEDYRGAVQMLAEHVAPDDVVIVQPPYIATLYQYYASRVTPDALPVARGFGRIGAIGYDQGEFDNDYAALLAGQRRGWLLIAPENAKAIDPPNPQYPQDDMGKVGINFLTADLNDKWRCTDLPYWEFNALRILCQSFPRPMQVENLALVGTWPIPKSATATWDNGLQLEGYQFQAWPAGYQAGGTLPVQLAWRTNNVLAKDYRLFIHLVPALGAPVAAQVDTMPLNGGLPTSRWQANQAIHDQVSVPLPKNLAKGHYLVVLGWYDPTIAAIEAQRLPVTTSTAQHGANYIELGTVEIE